MLRLIKGTAHTLLLSSCLRDLGQLLHLDEKHLDGGENLVPHTLLFVHCECAEGWKELAGYVSSGVVALGGCH